MIIQSLLPGALAPTENSFNADSTTGAGVENIDFSNLMASLVGAVRQTVVGTESTAEVTADSAESTADDDQVPQESDEIALDRSALVTFMAPFSPIVAAAEPPTASASETAAIAAAPFTEAAKVDANQAVEGDSGNYPPVNATQFSLSLEPTAAETALVQDWGDQIDRRTFVHQEGQLQNHDGAGRTANAPQSEVAAAAGIAAPLEVAIATEVLQRSEFTLRGELSSGIVELGVDQNKTKPAEILDSVVSADDSPAAAPSEFRSSGAEREVKSAERQTVNDSESFALESPAIEQKAPRLHLGADAQSSFANQHEQQWSADHSQLKPRETAVDRLEAPPPRLVAMPTEVLAARLIQENVAIENAGKAAWQPVVRQVSEEIVRQVRIGEQEAVIELEPPELGRIKIDLRVDGGQIHARIVAEEQSTQALIESRLTELRQALEVRQVDVANLQVEQQNVSSGGQWGQALSDGSRQGRGPWQDDAGFADRSANDAAQRENSQTPASDPGRISMWA